MRYEIVNGLKIPKIGFGTWRIGGHSSPDPKSDEKSLSALRTALKVGYTLFDTAESYAAGHAEELIGQAVREESAAREQLFITSKVSPEHLTYKGVLHSCENSLRRLGMDYIDLYLIHWPGYRMDLPEAFRALNQLVREGKVRHLGVSNFDLGLLKQSITLSDTPLLTNQVPYSLQDRTYADNGVLDYCQRNNILLTAYSPVKDQNLRNNRVLLAIAEAHRATPAQIALAWLTMQPCVITIPMSFEPTHQAENLQAADIILSESEMEQLE